MSVELRTVVSDLNYIRGTATPRQRLIDMTNMTKMQANDVFEFINYRIYSFCRTNSVTMSYGQLLMGKHTKKVSIG